MEKKYKVIVFDLGNVLIPFNYEIAFSRLEAIKLGLGEHYRAFLKDNYDLHRTFEAGKMDEEEFISKHLEALGGNVDRDTFCRIYSEIFTVNEDTAALLPVLRMNYRLMLLSNTNSIHKKFGWEQYDFLKNFEKLFLSHELGFVKPEREIYKAVTDYTGSPASEHIFIDDISEYAEGAKNCGWDAIQYKGYDDLVKNLSERGILQG